MLVLGVKDKWHPHNNGDESPEVRSDNPCWNGDPLAFIMWVKQHGGEMDDIYYIEGTVDDE